ncbi:MAG: thioredoxin domain-containing protein [Acidobacteria bacterium]|jgi:thiol-disulfide isomerase/thioredoxin|nr:thioredoxin domain-containing protein [Acidobacteriota bacterium]
MKRQILITTLISIFFAVYFPVFAGADLIWQTDWQQTLKTAVEKNQPVFIDFYTDWCPHCKRLDEITFSNNKVSEYFNKENYALLKINPEKDTEAENKFKVYSYPTLIVFKSDGTELDRMLGFKDPDELIKNLEDLKKGIGTLDDLLGKFKKYPETDKSSEKIATMFGILDKYIARADYPEALALIERIIELDEVNTQKQASAAMYQRGYIYYKWKKYDKAIEALLEINKVYPHSEEAEGGHASAIYYSEKIKNPKLTLELLKEFIKNFPASKYIERFNKKIAELETQNK